MAVRSKPDFPSDVIYPESDGEPMGETDTHWVATADLTLMLKARYRDADDVYVASDNFLYFEEGNPSAVISPDVYVVFGVPKRLRRVYKLWEEGRAPAAVFEISSRKTWVEDKGNKMAICAALGVAEYYLFDPELDYLDPPLQGYRLAGDRYTPIAPDTDGRIRSEALDLTLELEDGRLVLYHAQTGERLLRPAEESVARIAAEKTLSGERQARVTAEAEVARLKAELERLRGRS